MTRYFFTITLVIWVCACYARQCWEKIHIRETCVESYGSSLQITSVNSLLSCIYLCQKDPICISAIYAEVQKSCNTNSGAITSFPGGCSSLTKYIERQEISCQSSVPGLCSTEDDCKTINSTCNEGTCDCNHGLSYKKTGDVCVERCEDYGTTFSKGSHHKISGHNKVIFDSISVVDLMAACISASFTCRSIESKENGVGQLSMATAVIKPERFEPELTFTYYTRNCK